MLQLTRLGGPVFALNPDLIERAETTPDTVLTLVNGSKYMIRESLAELAELILAYRIEIVAGAQARAEGELLAPGSPHAEGPGAAGTVVSLYRGER